MTIGNDEELIKAIRRNDASEAEAIAGYLSGFTQDDIIRFIASDNPLHIAVKERNLEAIKIILEQPDSIVRGFVQWGNKDSDPKTPLELAIDQLIKVEQELRKEKGRWIDDTERSQFRASIELQVLLEVLKYCTAKELKQKRFLSAPLPKFPRTRKHIDTEKMQEWRETVNKAEQTELYLENYKDYAHMKGCYLTEDSLSHYSRPRAQKALRSLDRNRQHELLEVDQKGLFDAIYAQDNEEAKRLLTKYQDSLSIVYTTYCKDYRLPEPMNPLSAAIYQKNFELTKFILANEEMKQGCLLSAHLHAHSPLHRLLLYSDFEFFKSTLKYLTKDDCERALPDYAHKVDAMRLEAINLYTITAKEELSRLKKQETLNKAIETQENELAIDILTEYNTNKQLHLLTPSDSLSNPLHVAIKKSNKGIVLFILANETLRDSYLHEENTQQETPLFLALQQAFGNDATNSALAILMAVVKQSAKENIKHAIAQREKLPPTQKQQEHIEIYKELLSQITAKNSEGAISLLRRHAAKKLFCISDLATPLHHAVDAKDLGSVDHILSRSNMRSAFMEWLNSDKKTPLQLALDNARDREEDSDEFTIILLFIKHCNPDELNELQQCHWPNNKINNAMNAYSANEVKKTLKPLKAKDLSKLSQHKRQLFQAIEAHDNASSNNILKAYGSKAQLLFRLDDLSNPLHIAVTTKDMATIDFILKHREMLNYFATAANSAAKTPLEIVVDKAKESGEQSDEFRILVKLLMCGTIDVITKLKNFSETETHIKNAISIFSTQTTSRLRPADIDNFFNEKKKLFEYITKKDYQAAFNILKKYQYKFNARLFTRVSDLETPLHAAVKAKDHKLVERILSSQAMKKAFLYQKNSDGETPYDLAEQYSTAGPEEQIIFFSFIQNSDSNFFAERKAALLQSSGKHDNTQPINTIEELEKAIKAATNHTQVKKYLSSNIACIALLKDKESGVPFNPYQIALDAKNEHICEFIESDSAMKNAWCKNLQEDKEMTYFWIAKSKTEKSVIQVTKKGKDYVKCLIASSGNTEWMRFDKIENLAEITKTDYGYREFSFAESSFSAIMEELIAQGLFPGNAPSSAKLLTEAIDEEINREDTQIQVSNQEKKEQGWTHFFVKSTTSDYKKWMPKSYEIAPTNITMQEGLHKNGFFEPPKETSETDAETSETDAVNQCPICFNRFDSNMRAQVAFTKAGESSAYSVCEDCYENRIKGGMHPVNGDSIEEYTIVRITCC